MGRPLFVAAAVLSSVAVAAACASNPTADLADPTQDQKPTEPDPNEGSSKIPSSTSEPSEPKDAGADAKAVKDAAPPKKDAAPPPDNTFCDPTDAFIQAQLVLAPIMDPPPTTCPCSTGECCYLAAPNLPPEQFGLCFFTAP
jgi:hypothetical protein